MALQQTIFTTSERVWLYLSVTSAFLLGFIGYDIYFDTNTIEITLSDQFYATVGLYVMEYQAEFGKVLPWQLDVARWLAPASLSYAAGKAILSIMRSRILLLKIQRLRGHAIICGISEETLITIESFQKAGIQTLVIASSEELGMGRLEVCGTYVLESTDIDGQTLIRANIKHASYLLASTDNDSKNMSIVHIAYQLHQKKPKYRPINCAVSIRCANVSSALYDHDVFKTDNSNFTSHIIDFTRLSARKMVAQFGPDIWLSNLLSASTELRILAIGDHPLMDELVLHFAALGFYGAENNLHIKLMGNNASNRLASLHESRANLDQTIKLSANDFEPSILNNAIKNVIADFEPHIIYLCASTPELSLVWCHALNNLTLTIPIIVTELNSNFMFHFMAQENNENSSFKHVNLLEQSCSYQQVFNTQQDLLAQAIHKNYVSCQTELGESIVTNSSLVEWKALLETLKDANRNQADHLLIKCRLLTGKNNPSAEEVASTLSVDNIEKLARIEHKRWVAEKLLSGWRYTDGKKDTNLRLSPLLIDWGQLSESEKQKDRDTIINMPSLLHLHRKIIDI